MGACNHGRGGVGWTLVALVLALASCHASPRARRDGGRPGIVLFVGDDHTAIDLGCYGNAVVRTPAIDRIAAAGMRFSRAFTTTAMCSPSRSALYTGLGPHRNGCHANHGAVRPGVESLPCYLGALGYRVGLAGKGHVRPDSQFPFERLPAAAGEDELDMAGIEEFLARDEDPFCLVVASWQPHLPHRAGRFRGDEIPLPPNLLDTPETRQEMAGYYADIELLDNEVAEVDRILETLGLDGNTAVFYLSDHGYGLFAKWTCYDAGIRIPLIVRWPGVVAAGRETPAMVSVIDILPTLIDIAGGTPPAGLDGRSFLGVLRGDTDVHRRWIPAAHTNLGIVAGSPYPIRAVRDQRYKYIRNLLPSGTFENVLTQGRGALHWGGEPTWLSWVALAAHDPWAAERVQLYQHRPPEELYDVVADPFELHNRIGDPALAPEAARLRGILDAWMFEQGDAGLVAELSIEPREEGDD